MDALETKQSLSVIRMADGERAIMAQLHDFDRKGLVEPPEGHGPEWLERYGVKGITKELCVYNLTYAANNCTYFAPSITGVTSSAFDMYQFFPLRDQYVDNFFPDQFTIDQKTALFKQAKHVLLIHGNPSLADSMQLRVQANLQVKVSYLKLTHWTEASDIVDKADNIYSPLVLFSSGPASKWIGPAIANGKIPKVTLDLGHAADYWTMNHLPIDRTAAEKFHAEWRASCK
jgi:hypothetical protein